VIILFLNLKWFKLIFFIKGNSKYCNNIINNQQYQLQQQQQQHYQITTTTNKQPNISPTTTIVNNGNRNEADNNDNNENNELIPKTTTATVSIIFNESDFKILIDLYYLPFEYGKFSIYLLKEFQWIKLNLIRSNAENINVNFIFSKFNETNF
jgi:hypothetical protein